MTGWGQLLPEYLPEAEIRNHAMAGRSTKTFLSEGRLAGILPELRPGDLLLIQFAHNDEGDKPERHTEARGEFRENLKTFIRTAREASAVPVLLTPICIRCFRDGELLPTHGEYLEVVRELALEENVPLIDLYGVSFEAARALGEEDSMALYMRLRPGEDARWPDGLADDTHTRRPGAEIFARAAAESLRALL